MTFETLASIGVGIDTPRFRVMVGPLPLTDGLGRISELSVDRTIDGADRFSLSIAARYNHEFGAFVDLDLEVFAIGESVEIFLGYGVAHTRVFTGTVTEHSMDFPARGAPSVSVGGYGRYHELTRDITAEHWEGKTDSEIVEEIADNYDLEADVESTPINGGSVENEYASDAAFIEQKLAPRNDDGTNPFEVFARLDELVFRPPKQHRKPQLVLTYGVSLQSFSPTFTAATIPERVEARGWDFRRREDIVAVEESEGGQGRQIVRGSIQSEADAKRIADATVHRAENRGLRGTGRTIGLPGLDIGEPIILSGLGRRFSGTYYVEGVRHVYGSDGFTTEFTVRGARSEVAT